MKRHRIAPWKIVDWTTLVPDFPELDNLLLEGTHTVAPAIVCRVERAGKVVYEAAYGELFPASSGARVTVDCQFDLASITKLFTTTACLRLCTESTLSLETPVANVLPQFDGVRPIGPTEDPITKLPVATSPYWQSVTPTVDARNITVRHLLTHTSGLPAWRNVFSACGETPAPGFEMSKTEIARRRDEGIAAVCSYDFAYPTGLSYTYSDIGLILLGAVVAQAYGSGDLDSALRELVLSPLGLDAGFNPSVEQFDHIAPTEYCPWRARRLQGEVHDENAAGLGGIAGHAGLFGTAKDLCRLARLYLNDGEGLVGSDFLGKSLALQVAANAPGEPLPNPELPCATPNPNVRRGLGWMLPTPDSSCGPDWNQRGFGHTGYTGTSLWSDPDEELSVALLTNRVYWGRDPGPVHQLRVRVHSIVARELRWGV